jgi:hypothetical protein
MLFSPPAFAFRSTRRPRNIPPGSSRLRQGFSTASRGAHPLLIRLYFDASLYELARIVGYQGLTLEGARERVKPLEDQYGRERMEKAANELLVIDTEENTVRLTDEARRCCYQLLGPAPGHPHYFYLKEGPPLSSEADIRRWEESRRKALEPPAAAEPPPEEAPKKKRRPRKKAE